MKSEHLYQLAYLSSATHEPNNDDLGNILDVSVANNKLAQITGFLMYVEHSFFQIIEGPQTEIDRLYQSLLQDPRHCRVTKLLYEPITRRRFGDWSMAFIQYSQANHIPVDGFSSYLHDYLSTGENHLNFVERYNTDHLEQMIGSMRQNLIGI